MSMYRQMWLAIIVSTLLALLGGLLASTLNARTYLSEQLTAKNTDNATALALALSQQSPDPVLVELTVAALFDSGHYALIRVDDPHGKTIVERTAPDQAAFAPEWFVNALPLSVAPGQAKIANGWNQLGTLTLVSTSRFAYQALWKSVLQLTAALAFSGLIGGYLAALILRRLREPLQRVVEQASAISDRRFVSIELPDVPELRQLALAMNSTVSRLKTMFAEETQRLEVLRITANYDPVTGLPNRTFFMVQLLNQLDREDAVGGHLLLLRVADYTGLTRRIGLSATNELLKAFAEVLHQRETHTQGVAARIGESDFVLLLPSQVNAKETAVELLANLVAAGRSFHASEPIAHIGIGKLTAGQDIAGLMAQASSALAAAEVKGADSIQESNGVASMPTSEEETAQLIGKALDQGGIRLATHPVIGMDGQLVHQESLLELMLPGNSEWQTASRFLETAELFQLTPLLDLTALKLGLEKLKTDPELNGLAISVCAASLREADFRRRLLELLEENPSAARRLWLEVPEADILQHSLIVPEFVSAVRKANGRMGLTQFGRHFSHSDTLHDFGFDFIKVDSSFTRGLQYNTDNQTFLRDLAAAAHNMDMRVFGDGVVDPAELAALKAAGFDGAAGPFIKHPA